MKMAFLFAIGLVPFVFGLDCVRKRERMVPETDLPLVVKQLVRRQNKMAWAVETWLDAKNYSTIDPINLSIRLTPKNMQAKSPCAKISVKIASRDGKLLQEANLEPKFIECSTMARRREVQADGDQPVIIFPPKEQCWEIAVEDVFHTDRRKGEAILFPSGEYVLTVHLRIQDGPEFSLDDIRIAIKDRSIRR